MSAPDSEAPEVDQDGCDNERDRRKESMQKASFAFGFDTVNYRTSGGLMGDFDHAPNEDTCKDTSAVAEGMRKSSIWWKDSEFLAERKPSERYPTTHKVHFTEKPSSQTRWETIREVPDDPQG